ncbi:unnamed protein product [Parnassius apollo]|uniref:(apollo) hypothetical protein n=1 Tax=Parnassius apollo TaxID=110799 RepID=A0A8S3WKR2_PARAO|nr:unnamed protein product [Parnassius apollo]
MQKLTKRIDDLKQRIAAWGKRVRQYTERSTRFHQNRLFQSDQKRLYKSLERPMVSGTGPAPNQADTVAFWRGLWSEPINHSEGPRTEVVASQCASITPMNPVIITPNDVAEAVRRAPNWKSPGLDGLHHYWLKGFVVCQTVFARQFQEALNQKSLPSFFTTGITMLTRSVMWLNILILLNAIILLQSARQWSNRQLFPPSKIPDDGLNPQRPVVRRKIVLYHNFFRTKVQPTASNMLLMSWHAGAARQAQNYAERCIFLQHNDPQENTVPYLGSCGQNLFVAAQKTPW